ncbi:50S ribosomal protein L25/general stress protein Ctc [Prauserella endophytica]|uniref:Large ribosomal subunit protein bL25 n=1 Tax=Prauserella endophytica TaxID=1592324 RepID=A0ABY2RVC7_9PSEU|nr:50S ribosomal protein L25/general stress protein Ctc [Prauserella endophytica]PXY17710.1 50S ribosomal protein L25/general stress protein Ctc [Prauserella coralliicola]TKG62006.1 50S ribosomal protein L25/general stress protein Ctc [Prauserella endophytica]
MSEVRLTVEPRTEFGKGAARRTRRSGKIPAVLYGHGVDPRHLALPAIEFARVIRENGQNAVLTLDVAGAADKAEKATELALTKTVTIHPLKNYIEHVDLLIVHRGEKITVDVPIVLTGDPAPGTLVNQDVDTIQIEVEALHIPEQFEVSIENVEAGTQILASQVTLPKGAELVTDPDALVVAVNEAPSEAAMEAEVDTEGAGVVEDQPETTEGQNGE